MDSAPRDAGKDPSVGWASWLISLFIDSKLTPLAILASLLLGVAAVVMLPREEEPQIVVPMIDVLVEMPAASAREVEQRVTRPLEKLLWEIPGVEYIYSTSSPGRSLVIVRFEVGHSATEAIVKLNAKISNNLDRIPPTVSQPRPANRLTSRPTWQPTSRARAPGRTPSTSRSATSSRRSSATPQRGLSRCVAFEDE